MLEPEQTNHSHVTIMNERGKLKRREYRNGDQNIALLGLRGRNSNSGKEKHLKWVQISFGRSNAEGMSMPLHCSDNSCLPTVKTRNYFVNGATKHLFFTKAIWKNTGRRQEGNRSLLRCLRKEERDHSVCHLLETISCTIHESFPSTIS